MSDSTISSLVNGYVPYDAETTSTGDSGTDNALGNQEFLTLLVAQLENQNPLDPADGQVCQTVDGHHPQPFRRNTRLRGSGARLCNRRCLHGRGRDGESPRIFRPSCGSEAVRMDEL